MRANASARKIGSVLDAKRVAIFARRHAGRAPERVREMALIVEAGIERNLADTSRCRNQLALRRFDANTAHVIARRALQMRTKRADDARRMDARDIRDVVQRDALR